VHLNFALREPLVPDGEMPGEELAPGGPAAAVDHAPAAARAALGGRCRGLADELHARVSGGDRGRALGARSALGASLAAFAERRKVPLLADPLSGARRGPAAVAHYDALLRDDVGRRSRPELVLRVGDLPTSKPLRAWLAASDALQIAIDPEARGRTPRAWSAR
jgi:2-succinyl-5-enolpyruvyl-6-hydroxy-3-cyclohexene-1-carboxylate synthase